MLKDTWRFIALFSLSCSCVVGQSVAEVSQPNFIIILTDDQGYGDLGCFGGTHVKTPRIDQMAAEGVKLTSFYMAAAVCTPSRAALMTGSYPRRVGMALRVNLASDEKGLNPDEITIAEVLKGAGYQTGMFGKWHLGDQTEFLPTRQGFDEFFGLPYSHDIHPYHSNQRKYKFPPLPLLEGEQVVELEPDANYLTQRFTQRAIDFIEKHKDESFFLYLAHPIPHRPLHVSPAFMVNVPQEISHALTREDGTIDYKARDALYAQAISEIDWSVGEVLDALQRFGIDEDTIVIFSSDNGPSRFVELSSAGSLSGSKGTYREGGFRVPSVVRAPSRIAAGQSIDEVLTAMDLLPTFARLAGGVVPSDRAIDGQDIWSVLTAQAETPHQAFFYHQQNQLRAVRSGRWKLEVKNGRSVALYNLDQDIGEKHNLLKQNPEVAGRLAAFIPPFQVNLRENSRPAGLVENPKPQTLDK